MNVHSRYKDNLMDRILTEAKRKPKLFPAF